MLETLHIPTVSVLMLKNRLEKISHGSGYIWHPQNFREKEGDTSEPAHLLSITLAIDFFCIGSVLDRRLWKANLHGIQRMPGYRLNWRSSFDVPGMYM